MGYLKVLRLSRVQRQLRDTAPSTSLTDVTMRSGFLHLGRFATDLQSLLRGKPICHAATSGAR
jgi:transcriptional regulator GlxA family with amidase domain